MSLRAPRANLRGWRTCGWEDSLDRVHPLERADAITGCDRASRRTSAQRGGGWMGVLWKLSRRAGCSPLSLEKPEGA